MNPVKTCKDLGIPLSLYNHQHKIIQLYVQCRAFKNQPVWFPAKNGFLRFGKDAVECKKGMLLEHMGIPMCFSVDNFDGAYVIPYTPYNFAPTGINNKTDLMMLKYLKLLK